MKMYIYFDRNGTIKEVINDESIRRGSSDYNKIYCYLEGNPDIDDIWYLQKNPDGTLTNEVSFVDNIVTKAIPYDAKRDMKYFQDFEEYQFYVFTLSSSYLSQNGLVVATIRVAENNTLWALGELTFNVQANIVNSDNDITQSQYDYLLLTISSYYSKTEIDNKLNLKADKSDTYTKTEVDTINLNLAGQIAGARVELNNRINTTNNILVETNAKVASLETDVDTLQNNTYTKTEVDEKVDLKADKSEVNNVERSLKRDIDKVSAVTVALGNETQILRSDVDTLQDDIADLKSVQNVVEVVATKSALNSYDTSKLDVNDKVQVIADETHDGASTIYNWDGTQWQYVGAFGGNSYTKAETYNKTQIDSALSDKADKSNTYTRAVIDSMVLTLSTDKADKSNTYTKTEIDNTMQEVGEIVETLGKEVEKKANAEYISKGTTLTQTSYSNTNPTKSGKVKLYKLGGMSYKVNGTIQHSAVTEIRSKNGSTSVDRLSIPSYIRNIEGYGWGVNDTCYNYIDFENKKFVQKVGRVDLGTLTWNYNALGEPSYFYASIANAVNSINVSCSLYESAVVLPTNTEDKIICITQNQVRIRDNELEGSIVDLNTKLNGVYLYYERATLIETDISEYLTTDTLECIEGGTLEFLNTYNQAVPNEIAYLFNAVTLNNIVDSNGNTNVIATKQELNEKSKVVANPTLSGDEATLNGLEVDGTKYAVGGGSDKLYQHVVHITNYVGREVYCLELITRDNTPLTLANLVTILTNRYTAGPKEYFHVIPTKDTIYAVGAFIFDNAIRIRKSNLSDISNMENFDVTVLQNDIISEI